MSKRVPLVLYDRHGEQTVVGVAEVEGNEITGTITDERLIDIISNLDHCSFSISPEPAVPKDNKEVNIYL